MTLILWWIPFILYNILIFYLSSLPDIPGSERVPDEISHFFEFGILAVFFFVGWTKGFKRNIQKKHIFLIIFLSLLIALSDEIHQVFVPERIFSIKDLFFDALGIICFSILINKIDNILKKYS
ncbi:VanZ family protein [Candidatus Aminicenantes bacterium AH-873-B07]|jgi:VanZ family protein|nr:VanZ family protein [Candidatus Aminicenantes bacterium AH-873-B07]